MQGFWEFIHTMVGSERKGVSMLKSVSKLAILLGAFAVVAAGCDTGSRNSGGAAQDVDLTVTAFQSGFRSLPALEMATTSPQVGSQDISPTCTVDNGGTSLATSFLVNFVASTAPNVPTPGSRLYDFGRVSMLPGGANITLMQAPPMVGSTRLGSPGALPTPSGPPMMATFYKDPNDNHLLTGLANEIGMRAIDPSNGTAGMYMLGAIADGTSAITETDETNNIGVDGNTYTFAANMASPDLTPSSFLSFDFGGNPAQYNTNFDLNFTVQNVGGVTATACNIFCIVVDDQGNSTQPIMGTNNLGNLAAVAAGNQSMVSLTCNVNQNVMNPTNFQNGAVLQFFVWIDIDITAPAAMPPGNAFVPGNVSEGNEYNNGQTEFITFQ